MKIIITETQLRRVFLKEEESEKIESLAFILLDMLFENSVIKKITERSAYHDIGEILIIRDNRIIITKLPNNKVIINGHFLDGVLLNILPIERDRMFDFMTKWTKQIIKNRTESNKVSDAIKKRDG